MVSDTPYSQHNQNCVKQSERERERKYFSTRIRNARIGSAGAETSNRKELVRDRLPFGTQIDTTTQFRTIQANLSFYLWKFQHEIFFWSLCEEQENREPRAETSPIFFLPFSFFFTFFYSFFLSYTSILFHSLPLPSLSFDQEKKLPFRWAEKRLPFFVVLSLSLLFLSLYSEYLKFFLSFYLALLHFSFQEHENEQEKGKKRKKNVWEKREQHNSHIWENKAAQATKKNCAGHYHSRAVIFEH